MYYVQKLQSEELKKSQQKDPTPEFSSFHSLFVAETSHNHEKALTNGRRQDKPVSLVHQAVVYLTRPTKPTMTTPSLFLLHDEYRCGGDEYPLFRECTSFI